MRDRVSKIDQTVSTLSEILRSVKPTPQGTCPECDALWRKFAHATAEKLRIESQTAACDETQTRRESARMDIREHEALAHKGIALEATAGP
jgi:hypothetical protein